MLSMPPLTFSAPESASTFDAPNASVPAFTFVPPVKLFAPESVTVPAVSFVSATEPARIAEIVPLRTVKPAVLVSAEVPVPRIEPFSSVTAPTLSVRLAPMSRTPPSIVTAPVPIALLAPYASVPAETSVSPENVFVLVSRTVPAPVLMMPPAPETTPVKFTSPPAPSVTVMPVPNVTVPLKVFTPAVFSPPIVRRPVLPTGTEIGFATVRPAVAEKSSVAGVVVAAVASPTVIVPVAAPAAVFESRTTVPLRRTVPAP